MQVQSFSKVGIWYQMEERILKLIHCDPAKRLPAENNRQVFVRGRASGQMEYNLTKLMIILY